MLRIAHEGRCPFDRLVANRADDRPLHGLRRAALCERWLAEALDGVGLGGAYAPAAGEALPLAARAVRRQCADLRPRALRAHAATSCAPIPSLALGGPTIGWTHAAFRLMRQFAEPDYPRAIATPTLVIASGADRVVDTRASSDSPRGCAPAISSSSTARATRS